METASQLVGEDIQPQGSNSSSFPKKTRSGLSMMIGT